MCSAVAGALESELAIGEESKMKKTIVGASILMLMVILSGASCSTQTKAGDATSSRLASPSKLTSSLTSANDPVPVETRLSELFGFCKGDQIEAATPYFVYRGEDKAREWKDTFHADNAVERGAARDICLRIKNYLDENQGYSFGAVKVEKESEGEWHALEVTFEQGRDKRKKVIFAFLLIKGRYAIGDIDY